jgi:hypothetical protein
VNTIYLRIHPSKSIGKSIKKGGFVDIIPGLKTICGIVTQRG